MADKPILFNGPMMRAILDGRKVQTRRALSIRGHRRITKFGPSDTPGYDWQFRDAKLRWHDLTEAELCARLLYATGQSLWVREAWKPGAWLDDGRVAVDYRASPELTNTPWINLPETVDWGDLWQRWTDELLAAGSAPEQDGICRWEPGKSPLRWRPSVHMPRWASRLTLVVTDVRVERLQDISETDAIAEGLATISKDGGRLWKYGIPDSDGLPGTDDHGWPWSEWQRDPVLAFSRIWNETYGPDAWDKNPWLTAITFEAHQQNIDQMEAAHG